MGSIEIGVRVSNPAEHGQGEEITLLVDTGATFTVLPGDMWQRLDLRAETTRRLRTADGRVLERGQGLAYIEVDGQRGTVPVIEGGQGDMPVLGVTSLEILGLAIDPVRRVLVPTEHLYL